MKAKSHAWLRARLASWARRVRRWRGRSSGDDPRYLSPHEIALHNAADSLGVTLGEYYLVDPDLTDDDLASSDIPDAGRRDALREELLTYVARRGAQRQRRIRLLGIVAPSLVIALIVGVAIGGDMPWGEDRDQGARKVPDVPKPGEQIALWGPDRVMPVGGKGGGSPSKGLKALPGRSNTTDSACVGIWPLMGAAKENASTICHPSGQALAEFSRAPAFLAFVLFGRRQILLLGYARAGLRRIVAHRPRHRVEFAIGQPWRSGETVLGRGIMLKTFLVRVAHGSNLTPRLAPDQVLRRHGVYLSAVFRDGSTSSVRGLSEPEHDHARPPRLFDPIAATALRARGT